MAARELSGPHREGDEPKPMMQGVEGSDSAIVAVKRTNEAGRPAEEPVEPRAGAEENAEQNGTPRTPSRQGASHGLDRVRQAVRFAVKYPRWEPDALIGPVRFCAGAPSNGRPYRDLYLTPVPRHAADGPCPRSPPWPAHCLI